MGFWGEMKKSFMEGLNDGLKGVSDEEKQNMGFWESVKANFKQGFEDGYNGSNSYESEEEDYDDDNDSLAEARELFNQGCALVGKQIPEGISLITAAAERKVPEAALWMAEYYLAVFESNCPGIFNPQSNNNITDYAKSFCIYFSLAECLGVSTDELLKLMKVFTNHLLTELDAKYFAIEIFNPIRKKVFAKMREEEI